MLDATTRSGGTATVSPRTAAAELAVAAAGPVAPTGFAARVTRVLLSPWSRLSLLVALLVSAATTVVLFQPQQLLTNGWPPQLGGAAAAVAYAVAYGLCTVAFVPRPLLNLAAGALFGSQLGLASALAGTVLGAGVAFCLGRVLGQEALRPLLRGKWLKAADGQLSRHGFRTMLAMRLFPGCPSRRPTTARPCPAWVCSPSCWRRGSVRFPTPPPTSSRAPVPRRRPPPPS